MAAKPNRSGTSKPDNDDGGGGGGATSVITVDLSAATEIDPGSKINGSTSLGTLSTLIFDSGTLGLPDGGLDPTGWTFDIAAAIDFTAESAIIIRAHWDAATDSMGNYYICLVIYDASLTSDHGVWAYYRSNGNTATGVLGVNATTGSGAGSFENGGSLEFYAIADGALLRMRGVMATTSDMAGTPDTGQSVVAKHPTSWSGTNVKGALFIGTTTSQSGLTITDIAVDYEVISRKT